MHSLILHPDCRPGPITSVTASLRATPNGCQAEFRLHGDISAIKVPDTAIPERRDFLWQTTCFEIFWQPDGGTWYREFNLSPSSKWACYDFDHFRLNSRDAPVEAIAVASVHSADELVLRADIMAVLRDPAQVALNGIVEDLEGNIQFWALAFPHGKPEFHSEVCRKLRVERGA
ncbi:hypothetical protein G6N82_01375 [Altererythrobacter sp. BO-6]|uniref:hypothetical protein n=1 Tax=Altererythrobacter sp. BO-6 TaxID=2604537 RepID=UPI0013E1A408|nr:hypothetical protein [Altererythrobacter sp. BO-6]QIG52993.1 hypothetical protein G6N82_01375 [Altererythrobacter sp. BO-6]